MFEEYLQKSLSNIIMARQALYAFKMTSQKDLKNGASYHAQQAIELILKYCIYNNKRYRQANSGSKQIFSHDLENSYGIIAFPIILMFQRK